MRFSKSSLHESPLPQFLSHIIHLMSRQEDRDEKEREQGSRKISDCILSWSRTTRSSPKLKPKKDNLLAKVEVVVEAFFWEVLST